MKLVHVLFISAIISLNSCKKEDNTEPAAASYSPLGVQIIGNWKIIASTNNSTKSTSTYPGTIDDYIVTFGADSRLRSKGPCNQGGANSYLYTETGSLQIKGFLTTQAACSTTGGQWESRVKDDINNVYHANINGTTMEILTDGSHNLTLTKVN